MRVVGGKWKSRKINQLLKNNHYSIIRPTTDRIKENIFNIIQNVDVKNQIEGAYVLDIFCGTGAMGIEALSRGASFCQFIDNSPISSQVTLNNIKNLRCENETNFLFTNVLEIGDYELKKSDVVFMDPPYKKRISEVVIQRLLQNGWIDKDSLIILEKSKKEIFNLDAHLIDNRIYGNTEILFLKLKLFRKNSEFS